MSLRSLIKCIGALIITVALLTGCGGGGDMNFNVGTNNLGNNWPWPWQINADFFAFDTFSRSVPIVGHTNIKLEGENGEIVITGEPGVNFVTVVAELRVGSDTYVDALLGLDLLEVSLTDGSGEIVVQTVQPPNISGRQYIVDYSITVPSDLPVSINIANGHVSVNDMESSVFVILDNGDVNFSNIHGEADVNMDNGSFIGDISLPTGGEAVISTTNGDIDLSIPVSTAAELFGNINNNGTISWSNLVIGNLQTTSTSIQGTLGSGSGLVDLTTVNGDIVITGVN
jgi:hypothetical protein